MFGFSLQKLLLLLLIVGAVWYGFKFVNRLQQARDSEGKSRSRVSLPLRPQRLPLLISSRFA
jgi:predicted RND superfamily exporter protein